MKGTGTQIKPNTNQTETDPNQTNYDLLQLENFRTKLTKPNQTQTESIKQLKCPPIPRRNEQRMWLCTWKMDNIQSIDSFLASKMKQAYICKLIFYLHTHIHICTRWLCSKNNKKSRRFHKDRLWELMHLLLIPLRFLSTKKNV